MQRISLSVLIGLALALGMLAACQPSQPIQTSAAQPQSTAAIKVVQTYYAALAAKDLETVATLLAADVLATYPGGQI